jgi:hypothetical protein
MTMTLSVLVLRLVPGVRSVPLVMVRGAHRPRRKDGNRNVDLAGLLEAERQGDALAFLQRRAQPHQHDVKAARLEGRLALGRRLNPIHRSHLHDPLVVHRMAVQLCPLGGGGGDSDQTVGGRSEIDQRKVGGSGLVGAQRCSGPRMVDLQFGPRRLVGQGRLPGAKTGQQ